MCSRALVRLDPDRCPSCSAELVRYVVRQPALFFHAGYGAVEVTTRRWCPVCAWSITPDVGSESPRLLSRNGVDTGNGVVFTRDMSNTDTTAPATFEAGRTYIMRWVTDAELETPLTVVRRTARFATFAEADGTEHRTAVRSDERGEFALPLGRYSMAPRVRADRPA